MGEQRDVGCETDDSGRDAQPGISIGDDREQLIEALLRSDERAWRRFVGDYGPLIYRVLSGFPRLREQRDDAFQEVCVIIHRSLGSLREPAKLASWVYSIAYRHAADMTRKQARNPVLELSNVNENRLPATQATSGQQVEDLRRTAILLDLIAGMRPRCQQVLRALYVEDPPLSYEQLREKTGIPLGSIGPTRSRCLDELRRLWNMYHEAGRSASTLEKGPQQDRRGSAGRTERLRRMPRPEES